MSGEWSCDVCTFRHAFHGTRCSMCNSLRVTKQQMREFITGGGVNKDKQSDKQCNDLVGSNITNDCMADNTKSCENRKGMYSVRDKRGESTSMDESTRGPSLPIVNPYLKVNKDATPRNNGNKRPTNREIDGDSIRITEQRQMMKKSRHESSQTTRISPQSEDTFTVTRNLNQIVNPYAKVHPPVSTNLPQTSITTSNSLPSSSNVDNLSRQNGIPRDTPRKNVKGYDHETNVGFNQVSSRQSSKKRKRPESQSNTTHQTTLGFHLDRDYTNKTPTEQNYVLQGYIPGPVPLADGDICNTWIYPLNENYAERKYQLEIARSAILHNTLVSLPTGLGKTLIAAVVMYNFYRWFPQGKVVFLAPTRPLVRQQIEACYNIMGIPEIHTAEISGTIKDREHLWRTRRVFFCTPQACQRDIENGLCDAKMIVCLVLDEAHKTTKKYAYNIVLQHLRDVGAKARIVGLSATPGRDLKGIQEVIENLGVSKIEARVDTDPEVKPYVHDRSYEVVKVEPCTAEVSVANLLNKVLNPLIDMLRDRNALRLFRGPNSSLTSYNILLEQQQRKQQNDFSLVQQYSVVQALLSAREALNQNGILMARNKLSGFMEKFGCKGGFASRVLQSETFLNLWATIVKLQDTGKSFSQDDIDDLKLHNPKLEKLEFILKEHFNRARACNESSRAIVFSQLRDSVEEIVGVLSGLAPLVLATKFVGQGSGTSIEDASTPNTKRTRSTKVAGMNQKEQQRVIKEFRDGKFNVLVCTCIGEEGLDIGQVDLIVNFDCLRSPIRMIQRTGRTGRKRDGRVVCLVSKGKEEQRLQKSEADTRQLWNALKNPRAFTLAKNTPIFPVHPMLTRKDMNVARSYRLSQIGGHDHQRSVRRKNVEVLNLGSWKLTIEQENARLESFGRCSFDRSIMKECIKAWQNCALIGRQKICKAFGFGQSCSVLRKVEMSIIAEGKGGHLNHYSQTPHKPLLKDTNHECQRETFESNNSSQDSDGSSVEFDINNKKSFLHEEDSVRCRSSHSLENFQEANTTINDVPQVKDNPFLRSSDVQHNEFDPFSESDTRRFSTREINIIWGETDEHCHVEAPTNSGECRWFILKNDDGMEEVLHPMLSKDNLISSPKSTVSKSPLQTEDGYAIPSLNLASDQKCNEDNLSSSDSLDGDGGIRQSNSRCSPICMVEARLVQRKESLGNDDTLLLMEDNTLCVLEPNMDSCSMTNKDGTSSAKDSSLNSVKNVTCNLKRSTDDEYSVCFDLATPESSSSSDESDNDDTVEVIEFASVAQITRNNEDTIFNSTENLNASEENAKSQGSNHVSSSQKEEQPKSNEVKKHLSPADAMCDNRQPDDSRIGTNDAANEPKDSICHEQILKDATPLFDAEVEGKVKFSNTSKSSQDETPILFKSKSRKKQLDPFSTQSSPSPSLSRHQQAFKVSSKQKSGGEGKVNFSNISNTSQDETPILNKSKSTKKQLDPFLTQFSASPALSHHQQPSTLSLKHKAGGLYDTPASKHNDDRGIQSLDDTPQETYSVISKQSSLTISPEDRQRSKKQKVEKLVKRRKVKNVACKYLDIEAEVDGEDSEDDDEDENGVSQDSFINDSSQLGYTQDNLDAIDHDTELSQTSVNDASVTLHRQVDMMKERENAFATPTLRRKNNRMTQLSVPSSEKHLGKMHFIRSVIEHHRQGGDADELERGYHEILKAGGMPHTQNSTYLVEQKETPASTNTPTSKTIVPKKPTLTAEQLERIERNKQKALMIRRQRMKQM